MTEPIRVLVADDQPLLRGGFRVLIDAYVYGPLRAGAAGFLLKDAS
ncbi:hypothetical protein Q5762_02330 [Streptomyces sp. P9(2023)]|nr:hypothetical protein [Streptomyces sp. P9(2023)]MDT9687201.1 hypothetical protein [Streptomyces sp. P9(2023)]